MKKLLLLLAALPALALPAPPPPPAAPASPAVDAMSVPRPRGPEWFGVYLLGKKAGWSRLEVVRAERGGRAVLVATSETQFRVKVADREVTRSQRDEKVYEARPGGRLLTFSSERDGDGGHRRVEGACTADACRATLVAEGGPPEVHELAGPPETVEQADAFRLAAARRATVAGAALDLDQLRDEKMRDVFRGRERLAGAGVQIPVSIVEESKETDRIPARYAVADDGRVVELRWGDSLVAKAEPEAVAKRLDKVDLFSVSRVPLAAPLPQEVPSRVRFVVHGLPREFQKGEDGRQEYAEAASGETALTVTARLPAASVPARDAPRGAALPEADRELLEASPDVDWRDPEIRRQAAAVVGNTRGVFAASRKLVRFVYQRLEKVYGQSRDRASEVLRAGKGDCTEHALLFVALARAAGIPARGVHGLVYARYGDGVPALYWHAWAEVRSGSEWIAVDPTFGQPVADATHIALGRGTQADSVGLLGALKVVKAEPLPVK